MKDQFASFYGGMVHEGQFLEPVMRNIETFLSETQKNVTGNVKVFLAPYRFHIIGIESEYDLMSAKFGSYGEMNNAWSGDDVRGFSKVLGIQSSIWNKINN